MINIDYNKVFNYINGNDKLKKIFSFYINNCITLSNPYHNANHTLSMMYHICCIYEESQKDDYEFKLDLQGLYILLISAIFHDFNHSAGRFTDDINVSNACKIMEDYFTREFPNDIDTVERIKEIVHDNIIATCYPYVIEDDKLNLYQRILRECDILVSFSSDYFTQCAIGLKDELRINDWKLFLGNHIKFLMDSWKNMKLSYSLKLINEHQESLFNQIENILSIIS